MVSHCVTIKFILLTPVIINFLTIFPNNKKVSVLWASFFFFFGPPGITIFLKQQKHIPVTENIPKSIRKQGWINLHKFNS